MTKQELLQAIRDNWFSSDEDLVDFIFECMPELKEPPISPIIKCRAYKMPEIEEMKKAADKFFIGGDEE